MLYVTDDKVSLMLQVIDSRICIVGRVSCGLGFSLPHGMKFMDKGVVAHVRGGEGFSCEVSNRITELFVMSCDEAALLAIQ